MWVFPIWYFTFSSHFLFFYCDRNHLILKKNHWQKYHLHTKSQLQEWRQIQYYRRSFSVKFVSVTSEGNPAHREWHGAQSLRSNHWAALRPGCQTCEYPASNSAFGIPPRRMVREPPQQEVLLLTSTKEIPWRGLGGGVKLKVFFPIISTKSPGIVSLDQSWKLSHQSRGRRRVPCPL